MAVERVLSNLNLISFKTEGGLQNHIDELQDGDLVFTPDNSLKGNLFDFKWTDHKLNDISWLNADTFSWQSGDVYEAAYNHLAEDCKVYAWQYAPTQGGDIGYTTTETPAVGGVLMIGGNACNITEVGSDYVVAEHYKTGEARTYQRVAGSDSTAFVAGILSTETVDHITITFFRAKDGHKICSASQEENVRNLYDWMGVAWYYVLDEENKQFKLPRTKHAFTGLRDEVGKYVPAGLPNITGEWYSNAPSNYTTSGAIYSKVVSATNVPTTIGSGKYGFGFDASRSSSVYGNSNTVQPEATQMYLYFYVGNFERNAVEQTAGITAEMFNNKADIEQLNNKADKDFGNTEFALLKNNNGSLTWNDKNVITDADKEKVVGWGAPDYTRGVGISSGHVAQKNGYVTFAGKPSGGACFLYVDGVTVIRNQSSYGSSQVEFRDTVAVAKGSTITWSGGSTGATFYPVKGE